MYIRKSTKFCLVLELLKQQINNIRIYAKYKIVYLANGITQYKNLIEHEDFLNIIKPVQEKIQNLELQGKKKQSEVLALKNTLNNKLGSEWFTNQSPLYYAWFSRVLSLPEHQGGHHLVSLSIEEDYSL